MNLLRQGSPFAFGVMVAIEAFSGHAFAQAPPAVSAKPASAKPAAAVAPAAPAPAAAAPAPGALNAPDIVRLKNGGILRGTISELVPGDYVALILITGETRKVPFSEVQFAGAASDPANVAVAAPAPASAPAAAPAAAAALSTNNNKPSTTQPFAVVHAAESRVNVVSNPAGSTLFRRAASAGFNGIGAVSGYDEVCTAPCNVSMPAGTHTFAVAKPGGKPREADPVTLPAGDATMTVTHIDRTGIRVGVGVVGVAAMVGGFVLVYSATSNIENLSTGKLVAGTVLAAGGAGLIGLAIALPDGAEITVSPGAPPAAVSRTAYSKIALQLGDRRSDAGIVRDQLSGLTITARF